MTDRRYTARRGLAKKQKRLRNSSCATTGGATAHTIGTCLMTLVPVVSENGTYLYFRDVAHAFQKTGFSPSGTVATQWGFDPIARIMGLVSRDDRSSLQQHSVRRFQWRSRQAIVRYGHDSRSDYSQTLCWRWHSSAASTRLAPTAGYSRRENMIDLAPIPTKADPCW